MNRYDGIIICLTVFGAMVIGILGWYAYPQEQKNDPQIVTIDDKYVSFQQYGNDILLLTKPFSKDDRAEDHCIREKGRIVLIIREEMKNELGR